MDIAAKQQGFTLTDEFHRSVMGLDRNNSIKRYYEEFGPTFDCDLFYETIEKENNRIMDNGIPLMKGARELLDYLKQNGIKTCIGTSTPRLGTNNILTADNLLNDFDEIVCGDEIEHGKPSPEIYLKCFSKFDFKKEECLIFEDANAGAIAALDAGIRLVLVPDLAYLSEDSLNRAYKVINSLDEIIDVIKEENERATSI